jgi:hypothetical protein
LTLPKSPELGNFRLNMPTIQQGNRVKVSSGYEACVEVVVPAGGFAL